MSTQHFDATSELKLLHQQRAIARKRRYMHSQLGKYRKELVELFQAGGSYRDLGLWLRQQKRICISHTTVMRYLKKLPELNPTQ